MNRRTAVFSIAAGAVGLYADDKQPKKLTDAELEKLLQDEKNLFFLDVREPKEIQDLGSIKGYVNNPPGPAGITPERDSQGQADRHRLKPRDKSRACRGHPGETRFQSHRLLWISRVEGKGEAAGYSKEKEKEKE
jgi:hypothetical protein